PNSTPSASTCDPRLKHPRTTGRTAVLRAARPVAGCGAVVRIPTAPDIKAVAWTSSTAPAHVFQPGLVHPMTVRPPLERFRTGAPTPPRGSDHPGYTGSFPGFHLMPQPRLG